MLQTRVGKRTAAAALHIAIEMEKEGLISKEEAVMRVEPASSSTSFCIRSSIRTPSTMCSLAA